MTSRLPLLLCCLLSAPVMAATAAAATAADQAPTSPTPPTPPTPPASAPAPAPAAEDPRGDELRRAASAGDAAKVRELLAAGVDVNAACSIPRSELSTTRPGRPAPASAARAAYCNPSIWTPREGKRPSKE